MSQGKPNFSGSWKMVKTENFEDFLAANGANWLMRKAAVKASPKVHITHDGGDKFVIKTVLPVRTQEDSFTIGDVLHSQAMSGNKIKTTTSWDGDAVVLASEPEEEGKGKPYTVRREIIDGQLVLTMSIDDVVCKRWFDKD